MTAPPTRTSRSRRIRTQAPAPITVKLLVGNGTSSTTISASCRRSARTGNPVAAVPAARWFLTSNVYVTFFGDGCTAISGNCSAKADVGVRRERDGYDFTCAHAHLFVGLR